MDTALCIHGHFYQPPREDPWLGRILPEASAAPMNDWNERILRESYAPLAWARRLDGSGRIGDIMNCYEWMGFNVGPTLLHWLRRNAPELVERMREGDANSLARWGHGNAIAQIYHHVIMPLADPEDRELEVRWAVDAFRHFFRREPEGMWLSEAAVDLPSLETLAANGIRFVILAPRQARAVIDSSGRHEVNESSLSIGEPYLVRLPSGGSITAVFYHGPLSQGIAFESLLGDGERFWRRIASEAAKLDARLKSPLLTLATDGETYGHHFKFGEMALAHVLAQGYARRDGIRLTNIAAHIAANPPVKEVILYEPSSWSCVHGIERWRSDCGCTDGGHPGWNQKWRAPLRKALEYMRSGVSSHFAKAGAECLTDPRGALLDYGSLLADPSRKEDFAARWFRKEGENNGVLADRAWKLLGAQEQSLAAFASCAWFFDDIARIEPENAMTFALYAMDLVQETGGPSLHEKFAAGLGEAVSNQKNMGTGSDVFNKEILPRRGDAAGQCLLAMLLLRAEERWPAPGQSARYEWPALSVEISPEDAFPAESGGNVPVLLRGTAVIRHFFENRGTRYSWNYSPPSEREGKAFVDIFKASVFIRAEDGTEMRAGVDAFSKRAHDYLAACLVLGAEKRERDGHLTLARHILSLLQPWEEEQTAVIRPELYHDVAPYLAVAAVLDENIDEDRLVQAKTFLSQHLSAGGRVLAGSLVCNSIKKRLDVSADLPENSSDVEDAALAPVVRRLRDILPEADLWEVQNLLWRKEIRRFPLLADALGFQGV